MGGLPFFSEEDTQFVPTQPAPPPPGSGPISGLHHYGPAGIPEPAHGPDVMPKPREPYVMPNVSYRPGNIPYTGLYHLLPSGRPSAMEPQAYGTPNNNQNDWGGLPNTGWEAGENAPPQIKGSSQLGSVRTPMSSAISGLRFG
jgi:hypothetical protein